MGGGEADEHTCVCMCEGSGDCWVLLAYDPPGWLSWWAGLSVCEVRSLQPLSMATPDFGSKWPQMRFQAPAQVAQTTIRSLDLLGSTLSSKVREAGVTRQARNRLLSPADLLWCGGCV